MSFLPLRPLLSSLAISIIKSIHNSQLLGFYGPLEREFLKLNNPQINLLRPDLERPWRFTTHCWCFRRYHTTTSSSMMELLKKSRDALKSLFGILATKGLICTLAINKPTFRCIAAIASVGSDGVTFLLIRSLLWS